MLDSTNSITEFFQNHYPLISSSLSSITALSGGFVNYVHRVSFDCEVSLDDINQYPYFIVILTLF